MTIDAPTYTRAQVEGAIWWLLTHPETATLAVWLGENDPEVAEGRQRLARRRPPAPDTRRQRVHSCPHCRCQEVRT